MSLTKNDVDAAIATGDFRQRRALLREFDNLVSGQTRQAVPDPEEFRQAGQRLAAANRKRPSAIDGQDDRTDVVNLAHRTEVSAGPAAFANSRAVALLTDESLLTEQDGRWRLTTAQFGAVKQLCRSERFFERPVSTPATAFLVQKDLLLTLRHNLALFSSTEKMRVIFNFEMQSDGTFKLDFGPDEIYEVIEHYSFVDDSRNAFVALRLSRAVKDRTPVVCNFGAPIGANQPVYVIGHPCGLPKIFADNAVVLDASSAVAFTASLDAFAGDSGAPVFDARTGQVEGILAEGGDDFQWVPDGQGGFCNFSIVYRAAAPFGYKVIRIQKLQQLLNA